MRLTNIFTITAIFLTTASISGCNSLSDVLISKQRGDGTSMEYAISKEQAWDMAHTVLRWEGVDAIEDHLNQSYMLTSIGMGLGTYGAVVGVFIEEGSKQGMTKVSIITKRRVATDLFTGLTETTYIRDFGKAVEIVNSGGKLPLLERPKS